MCFAAQQLGQSGCDNTLRWAKRWRDLRMPRATGLEARLARRGACCCDCEIFLDGWTLCGDLLVVDPVTGDADWPGGCRSARA